MGLQWQRKDRLQMRNVGSQYQKVTIIRLIDILDGYLGIQGLKTYCQERQGEKNRRNLS